MLKDSGGLGSPSELFVWKQIPSQSPWAFSPGKTVVVLFFFCSFKMKYVVTTSSNIDPAIAMEHLSWIMNKTQLGHLHLWFRFQPVDVYWPQSQNLLHALLSRWRWFQMSWTVHPYFWVSDDPISPRISVEMGWVPRVVPWFQFLITITLTGEFTSGWMLLQKISVFPPFFCWGLTLTTNIRNLRMCLLTVSQLQLVFEPSGPWYGFRKGGFFRQEKHGRPTNDISEVYRGPP